MMRRKNLKKLIHIEKQRDQARRIQNTLNSKQGGGVTSILIPAATEYDEGVDKMDVHVMWDRLQIANGNDVKNWDRITDRKTMEKLLLHWQQKHFQQANETPLANTNWARKLTDHKIQHAIQRGDFDTPKSLPKEVHELLKSMKRPSCITNDIRPYTTIGEFRKFIHITKERTSSSPSGRHYGHYKALLEAKPTFLHVIHGIIELVVRHNVILDRWKTTNTTLLEKNPGTPFVHRLRAIHIVEGDFQFIAKYYYSHKMMALAEKHQLVSDEQYGRRANRKAQSAVLNKVLYYNICHQTVTPAAFMEDDARACYDRIITPLSSVECTKWGLPLEIANFTTNFIQSQKFHIRTTHGTSEDSYEYDEENPIQGSGQGISWSGPRWTATGDAICRIMQKDCAGMLFQDPSGEIVVAKNGDHFVDDRATGVTGNTTGITPLQQLEHDEQRHAHLLYAAGHKLALDKCWYYYLDYKRKGTKHVFKSIDELPGEMNLRESFEGRLMKIKRLEPTVARRALGCFIAPASTQHTQIDVLQEKITKWSHKVQSSHLSKEDKIKAYHAYIEKTILLPLPTTSMTYAECEQITQYLSPILLNIHGIQRNCARRPIYCPLEFGGLDKLSIFHLQGISKLRFLLMHLRREDTTGKLMDISMRTTQLECGLSTPFLKNDYYKTQMLATETWLTNLWQYCTECEISIQDTKNWNYQVPRKNDFHIMDVIMSSDLNDEQKAMFNQVRLKLKLLTASDVVLADSGTRIHPDIYQGTNHRASTIQWPKVLDFPKAWYTLFQSVMVNIIAPKLQSNPLGKWISQGHQRWQYFENNNTVKYVKYKKQYIREGETSLDDRIYPVDVNDRNGKILGRAPNVYDEDENQSECT